MHTLHHLLVHELSDLYSAEKQLTKALPKMAKGATNENLRAAIEDHLEVTKGQIERLDEIFKQLEEKPKRQKCKAMEGLIEEGAGIIEEKGMPAVIDAAIIAAAQRVEHYEIAAYGSARAFAEKLGHKKIVSLLQETLDEEGQADKDLNDLAESEINEDALVATDTE